MISPSRTSAFTVAPTQKTPSLGARRHARVLRTTPTGARKTANPKVGSESVVIASAHTSAAQDHLLRERDDASVAVGNVEPITLNGNGGARLVVASTPAGDLGSAAQEARDYPKAFPDGSGAASPTGTGGSPVSS